MADRRAVNTVRSWLAHRRDHRALGSDHGGPDPEPADQRPATPHEESAGRRLLAGVGMDTLAGTPVALQQLRRTAKHSRFGQMSSSDRISLVPDALERSLLPYERPEH